MTTKEKAINAAYIASGLNIDMGKVSNNGWIESTEVKQLYSDKGLDKNFEQSSPDRSVFPPNFGVRPKSLKGIENNNGWTRIETDDDLPIDESADYFTGVITKPHPDGSTFIQFRDAQKALDVRSEWKRKNITHFRIAEQFKDPIF